MKLTLLGERDVPLHRPGVCWVNSWERAQLRGFGDVPPREPTLTYQNIPIIWNPVFDEPLPVVDAATVGDIGDWRTCIDGDGYAWVRSMARQQYEQRLMKLTLDSLQGVSQLIDWEPGSRFEWGMTHREPIQFYENTSDSARAADWIDSQLGDVPLRHVSDTGIAFDVRPVWPREHTDAATVGDTGLPRTWLQNGPLIATATVTCIRDTVHLGERVCMCDRCLRYRRWITGEAAAP